MPTKRKFVTHEFGGGWATDLGNRITTNFVTDDRVRFPHLLQADNVTYRLDGAIVKAPGTAKINSAAFESGADIMGCFDYWITGTSGAPAQHRICHVGTVIKKDDADASFTDLFTGLEAGKIPSYAVLEDLLVMTSNSTVDVPKSWDGTTAQNLAGSPQNFSFMATHHNRLWAAGDASNPGRLYYSGFLDATNWTAGGSGQIDVDPRDGDSITGLVSFLGDLWVFKGPYTGSIHRIIGTAPTGSDSFRKREFISGIGAVNHNSIFRMLDDVAFMWSDGMVYSLKAVEKFGDFAAASLSRPIRRWVQRNVDFSRLNQTYAETLPGDGYALIGVPTTKDTTNDTLLMMDFKHSPVRWSNWTSHKNAAVSVAKMVDAGSNDQQILMTGGTDGFLRKMNQTTNLIDGTSSINSNVRSPFIDYNLPSKIKTISQVAIASNPTTDATITFGWNRDTRGAQTTNLSVTSGSDLLDSTFIVNQSVLSSEDQILNRFQELEDGGEFRSIQYSISNNEFGANMVVQDFSTMVEVGADSSENF